MTILGGFLNGSLVPILDHVQSVQFMKWNLKHNDLNCQSHRERLIIQAPDKNKPALFIVGLPSAE